MFCYKAANFIFMCLSLKKIGHLLKYNLYTSKCSELNFYELHNCLNSFVYDPQQGKEDFNTLKAFILPFFNQPLPLSGDHIFFF